jgi:hypothetical protein
MNHAAWRTTLLGILAILFLLVGCEPTPHTPQPPPTPSIALVEENHGWVQVRVTGVPSAGYRLHWGDVSTGYGISEVSKDQPTYEHFYQAADGETSGGQIPTTYTIQLTDPQGRVAAQCTVLVHRVDCYLSLVSLEGRTVTVRYWGRFGIQYSISWGDGYAEHIIVDFQTGSGTLTHTYDHAGTYQLGMEEIWSPTRIFFTLTVP